MVTAVIRWQKLIGTLRIADNTVKINDRIEVSGGANPAVHCLPISLAERPRMIVSGSNVRGDCGSDYAQPVSMRADNDLLIRRQHPLNQRRMLPRGNFAVAR